MERARHYVLIFLVASLSSTVLLKIGEIQYLELILAADFLVLSGLFIRDRCRTRVFRPYLNIAGHYGTFLGLTFLLGVIALRQNFYLFSDSFLKRPLLLTVSRMAELFLDVFYMLYLASLYREDEKLCVFGAKTYYWVGIAGSIYGVASYPLNVGFGLQLGTYSDAHRIRGFYNEAGPYGIYLTSVGLLGICMYRRKWLSRRQFFWSMGLILISLAGSQSKAAFLALSVLVVIDLIWSLRGWKRLAIVTGACALAALVLIEIDLVAKVGIYEQASASYQKVSLLKSDDGNFVMGRVAGAILAPRMIEEHPWLGIGWGNYPLVRDDPQYRQGTAFSMGATDAPALGPIDYIVDLGVPLWLYMTWISLRPVSLLRRNGADIWLVSLAMVQPLSNWFGAHLNLTYPWVIVGLALGMGFMRRPDDGNRFRTLAMH